MMPSSRSKEGQTAAERGACENHSVGYMGIYFLKVVESLILHKRFEFITYYVGSNRSKKYERETGKIAMRMFVDGTKLECTRAFLVSNIII